MSESSNRFSWKGRVVRAISTGVLASMLLAPALQAADPDQKSATGVASPASETAQPNAVTADDGGSWEVGIHGTAGNLTTATAAERAGMWAWLNGWFVRRYSYAEGSSWESDFKRAAMGGNENSYLDTVDLQFYVGHGAPGLFTFDNATHDDGTLNASTDCDTSWGDGDNEWLALTSCQVLSGDGLGKMAQCMNRQHLILGFVTNASAHNNYQDTQAYHFGRYMRYGYNMTSSWFNACDVAQRGRTARVIAEETACFNDNPYYGSVCADSIDSDYYWYTHSCGTESANALPVGIMAEVPVFKVKAFATAEETNAAFGRLGTIFSVPLTPTVQSAAGNEGPVDPPDQPASSPFAVSSNLSKTLEMDKSNGMYKYIDQNALFSQATVEQALTVNAAAVNYIDGNNAKSIADAFLTNNGLMSADSQFYEVISDTTGTLDKGINVSAADISEAEVPAVWQVIYSRKLSADVLTSAGATEAMTFTVVGPGAKQKVYVPLTGQVDAAGNVNADPIGAQGGWRDLEAAINAATGEQIMVTIEPSDTIESLYLTLDKAVTMNSIPLDIISRTVISKTLAYWENAAGSSQGELIPVYELTVAYTDASTGVAGQDLFYVPAAAQYMAPYAQILDAPANVAGGSVVTLTAADASKTLKALGVGDQFDFVMGKGEFTYNWYLGAAVDENKLASCNGKKACSLNLPTNTGDKDASALVTLVVSDLGSPNVTVSTTTAEITINPSVFLPLITR